MNRIPTYDDFIRGLRANALSEIDLDVLSHFLAADGHSLTAAELTGCLGHEGHEYGNLCMGSLGRALAGAMSFIPNRRERDQSLMYWNVVASGQHDTRGEGHFRWTLHPDLVAALRQFPVHPTSGRRNLRATPADELPELDDERLRKIAERRERRRREHG